MLIQQVVAFLLAGALMTSGTAGTDLKDVPQDNWAYPYVSYIVEHDVMYTTKTGNFLGEVQINRGDFIISLWRAAGSPAVGSVTFSDVTTGHTAGDLSGYGRRSILSRRLSDAGRGVCVPVAGAACFRRGAAGGAVRRTG